MVGLDVVAAFGVPGDHRDRVRLDYQILRQPACFVGGGRCRRLIWVPDGDQVSHIVLISLEPFMLPREGTSSILPPARRSALTLPGDSAGGTPRRSRAATARRGRSRFTDRGWPPRG